MIAGSHGATGIMRAQANFDDIVRVRPIRVMILGLGNCGNLDHECKGGSEVGELKLSIQRVVDFHPTDWHTTMLIEP